MPYVVLNNQEMNWKASGKKDSYQAMLTSACNAMEAEGYRLVQIEEGDPDSADSPYYFFYSEE